MVWLDQGFPESCPTQVMVSVSKRNFSKASDRNYIKRRMRESWRLLRGPLEETLAAQNKQLCVGFIFLGNELQDFNIIYEKIALCITYLVRLHE